MTGEISPIACLRELSISNRSEPVVHSLSIDDISAIGRDPRCQIVVDPVLFGSVSRRHAEVRPSEQSEERPTWWLCDLNSSNGTYLNGKRLRGCQLLKSGDRISLGSDGPEYIFEYLEDLNQRAASVTDQPAAIPQVRESVTLTQLFPIVSTGRDLTSKAFLVPSIITIIFVVSLFVAVGQPNLFNRLLAGYIALVGLYFVYRLCGKRKPWWVMVLAAMGTYFLLRSPVLLWFAEFFRSTLPGQVTAPGEMINPFTLFVRMFFGAGLMEELLKVIPLAVLLVIGRLLPAPWNDRVGIWEPLDGILLGAASAVGFTLVETLGQYVPGMIQSTSLQIGEAGWDQLKGLQVLIPRLLGSISGHMAYSGYFGYFIGLAVLKPRQSWLILLIGYFTASALHALWNVMGSVSEILLALVGMLSYAFLAAAILKARTLSPTRSQNFATRLKS
jgi:RsiW-degrading membrane proteinase PrsW (M82 family)